MDLGFFQRVRHRAGPPGVLGARLSFRFHPGAPPSPVRASHFGLLRERPACSFDLHGEYCVTSPSRSGVFETSTDQRVDCFTESISFDRRLYAQDIAGSTAHAQMLADVGLITDQECQQMLGGLEAIRGEIEREQFPWRVELEDIHMHIEQALIDRLGEVGRKLHTGRSRNDQVGTATRLWIREAIDRIDERLLALQRAFVGRCDADADVVLPGYTHLQRAQPVLAPHYWLAYCEKFDRDRDRLAACRGRVNSCPLGAAALAGSSLPIDRQNVARRLGFESVMANSLDASSDRDFVLEPLFALSLIATHLSTWAEEWILWSTAEFGFLKLPQRFCTGSSIMPQKVNPDILELTRGKTARVLGALQTVLILVKGLPLAYNRDLQEDKPPLFDAFDTVQACLELAEPLVAGAELNRAAICVAVGRGIPGRHDIHGIVDSSRNGSTPRASSGGTIGRPGDGEKGAAGRPAAGGVPAARSGIGRVRV